MYIIKYLWWSQISTLSNEGTIVPWIAKIKDVWKLYTINYHKILTLYDKYIYNNINLNPWLNELSVLFMPIDDMELAIQTTKALNPKIVCPISYGEAITWPEWVHFANQIMLHTSSVPKYLKPWQSIVLK